MTIEIFDYMTRKRFILMLLVMLLGVTTSWAIDNVPYVDMEVRTDAEGHVTVTPVAKTADNVTVITSSSSTLSAGWYVVKNDAEVTTSTLVCEGEVHLILADRAKLTATGGHSDASIRVSAEGASLTIYGQTDQTGQLIAKGGTFGAGIGGGRDGAGHNITINGGVITATGVIGGAGIGGGSYSAGHDIIINAGAITATGGDWASAIGGGRGSEGYNITINGGVITATGDFYSAGIGGGSDSDGYDITINGGTITATGGEDAPAIGGGDGGESYNIFVNSSILLYADGDNPPITLIEHTSGVDISDKLSGKRYAIVRKPTMGVTVTFSKQEGTGGDDQTTVNEGDPMPTITIPSREGYAFVGYYSDTNGTGTKYYNNDGTSARPWNKVENTTLYAYWSNHVQYIDADGSKKQVGIDSEITNTTTTLVSGWYIVRDADVRTGTIKCEGDVNLILADGAKLTATGEWANAGIRVSAEGASLTIYGQEGQSGQLIAKGSFFAAGIGGVENSNSHDITINGGVITATGGDWASAIGGGYGGGSSNIYVNSSLVLYADNNNPPTTITEHTSVEDISGKLSGKKYAILRTPIQGIMVNFDKQDGNGGDDQTTVNEGAPMPTINVPTREGYVFVGYYSGKNGTGTKYYGADGTSVHLWDKWENTTLYAYWTQPCVVTLDLHGGSGGTTQVEAIYDSPMPTITVPTRDGATFNGYYAGEDGMGTKYYNADGTSAHLWDKVENVTLYAYWKSPVSYIDADGTTKYAVPDVVTTMTTTMSNGWYVVNQADLQTGSITCEGAVHLILADDAKLIATGGEDLAGIHVNAEGASLTIYGQTNQTGQLIAKGGVRAAGIGGSRLVHEHVHGHDIIINGGVITAIGGGLGAGIGGANFGNAYNITINGGMITAIGGSKASGIGGGRSGTANNIIINGGVITASGGADGCAIGGEDPEEGFYSSNIFVNSSLVLYADNNNPPTTEIKHTSAVDLASVLSDKRYLTAHMHQYDESREEGAAYYTCSVCGYIDPIRQHVHNYREEWSTDGTRHWHECTSEVGTCTVPTVDEGEHNYDNSAVEGTVAYYSCGTCGYIDPVRQHVHNYEWVVVDEHQHKQVCTSEVGTCIAREQNEGEHNIHESILCDTENYLCDVCEYVDDAKKAQFGERDYMSMTAVGGDVAVGFKKVGSPTDYTIQVSVDGNHWSEPQTLNTETTLATIPEGKTYFFRHGSATAIDKISSNQSNHWSFTMTGDGTIEADGKIISLIDATCQKNSLAGSPQHVFTALFKGCEKLTVAPELPFPATGEFNYMYMFEGTSISVAPQLPATTVAAGAYMGMFKDCKKLETVPILPATTVGRRGYQEMFSGCEKLKTLEIANITTVTSSADGAFTNWLTGTAADTDGKLTAPLDGICNTKIPAECIPSNWQWATKLKANEDPDNDGNFYTTFFDSRFDYKVENGFKAYTGIITNTEDDERELRLTATPNKIIPKGDGVIIHGGSGEVLLTVSNGSAGRVDGNVLTGSDTDTTAPDFCYILSYGQQRLGFYKYEEGKALSAHKAYLTYEPVPGVLAKALRMVFVDDEVDGIESISSDSANSPIGIYSVNGVRLNKLQKGINIVNGKKMIIK